MVKSASQFIRLLLLFVLAKVVNAASIKLREGLILEGDKGGKSSNVRSIAYNLFSKCGVSIGLPALAFLLHRRGMSRSKLMSVQAAVKYMSSSPSGGCVWQLSPRLSRYRGSGNQKLWHGWSKHSGFAEKPGPIEGCFECSWAQGPFPWSWMGKAGDCHYCRRP